jgi:hypothetical protein
MASDSVRSRATTLLRQYDNDDFKEQHLGYIDHDAIEDGNFDGVARALDARIERDRYSLISMLLAGIYFGLLVGHNMFSTATTTQVLWWAVPVLLVSIYAVVTANNLFRRLQELSRARALVESLDAEVGVEG